MKYGTGLSITEPPEITPVRDQVQALDGAGFDYVGLPGHVLGAVADRYPERPTMTYVGPFHDPFVLFAYLAGVTQNIHFMNTILILPLYPTALAAKQAAELSYVSGGRYEMGIGISWNPDEYEALGQTFTNRGRRSEEQIELMRKFWADPVVTFEGKYQKINGLGLNRPPLDIPVWIGSGTDDRLLRRVARLADGWLPTGDTAEAMTRLRPMLEQEGRNPADLKLQGRVVATPEGPSAWVEAGKAQAAIGVTHISLGAAPGTPPAQALQTLIEAKRVLSEELG